MMSEMEYLNILPDIEKLDNDMDESGFWKESFTDKNDTSNRKNDIEGSLETSKNEEDVAKA